MSRRDRIDRIQRRFERLYGRDRADRCVRRLKLLLNRYDAQLCVLPVQERWNEADNVLITYGDMVRSNDNGEKPLGTLARFLDQRLRGVIDTVHILPFFPYSSDDGFSVKDYRTVDPELGDWEDVHAVGCNFRLMFDLVLNHCSRRSEWFRDYVAGIAPMRYYFVEADPETADLSRVVRPRATPLLSKVRTRTGERWVWTTFSEDQVDLDFSNPDVLLEFVDILLCYVAHGARIIRLDAIAYLWKQLGTACIHLPQTHEIVRFFRDLLELIAPHVLLLTETNVPHEQNISYFGDGDEAQMVYNFALPPLLLHALRTGTSEHLTRWAEGVPAPPAGCTYLNFTASHDGIGLRPLEGLLPDEEVRDLCGHVERLGGHVSYKSNPDGSNSPYELNTTYFDALATDDDGEAGSKNQIRRFLCSQAVALALRGIPAVYFHSLTATRNDHEGVQRLGHARAINRHKWDLERLDQLLADPETPHARVFAEYKRLLQIRSWQRAFHPNGPQHVLSLSDEVFAVQRTAPDGSQTLLSVSNFTPRRVGLELDEAGSFPGGTACRDLLQPADGPLPIDRIELEPYQTRWLTPAEGPEAR